jgi:ABC-type amino acid transport substrate-binding protein
MALATIETGVLRVGAALPDPPFEVAGAAPAGFDIAFMQAVAGELGLRWRLARFAGADFNAIFDGLADGSWDCVASGATVTAERERVARFCAPYLRSGQGLACNVERTPEARSVDDLRGLVLGVQDGNTSEPVARQLRAEGRVGAVRVYPYHAIGAMLDDLEAGRLGAVMKLAPVLRWLTRGRPALAVVQDGLTDERIAVAVGPANAALSDAIDAAQARLAARGTLAELAHEWRLA